MDRQGVGEVSFLVNNAGILFGKQIQSMEPWEVEKIFGVNVLGQIYVAMEFLPYMREANRGQIVSMSSTAGVIGTPYLTTYCSTKFANAGFMDALNQELFFVRIGYMYGIRANVATSMLYFV